jgi:hypothetical protein
MPMRTSSDDQPPSPAERSKAWSCLVTNLLVLPGLGSVMAGRKVGYLQMLLSLGGFVLTLVALVRIVLLWAQDFQLPPEPGLYRSAIIGLAVVLLAWCWSLLTSLAEFRRRHP